MAAPKNRADNWVFGPAFEDTDSPTGWSQLMYNISIESEHAEWWAAWETHLNNREARPDAPARGKGGPGEGPGKPAQPRLAEVKEFLANSTSQFEFILAMKAIANGTSKYDRFTPKQYDALVRMVDKDKAYKAQKEAAKDDTLNNIEENDIRFDNFPYGTFKFAVMNDSGNLTFIRIDHVAEYDKFKQKSRWYNWTFVKHILGGNENKMGAARPGQGYVGQWDNLVRKVLANPKEAMIRYGKEIGECGDCGRRLTNAASREMGIGPICAAKEIF
jgi:hypothetical protein